MRILLRLAVLIVSTGSLFGQEATQQDSRPAWVFFELAEEAARPDNPERNYPEALRLYARALEVQPVYPEAYAGLARVYYREGDITLARRYYELALEQAASLDIPDEEFALQLELAAMLEQSGESRDVRNILRRVINRDPVFSGDDGGTQRRAMRRQLYDEGLNRVLVLYRLDFPQALEAHREYARYLLEQPGADSSNQAVEHLLFAVVEIAGRAVEAIIDREFDFQFTTIADLLLTARRYPEVQRYLEETGFVDLLLQLAAALDSAQPEDEFSPADARQAAAAIREDVQATLSLQR